MRWLRPGVLRLFLASRLLLAAVGALGLYLSPPEAPAGVLGPLRAFPDAPWLDAWCRWDANWYRDIAVHGYSSEPRLDFQRNTAFFPLYPLLVRAATFGLLDAYVAGILLSNLCLLAGLAFLDRLVSEQAGPEAAHLTLALLCFYPCSLFLSTLYAEALLLALVALMFWSAGRGRWITAGLAGSLAALTKPIGVVALAALAVHYADDVRRGRERARLEHLLALAVALAGPAVMLAEMRLLLGSALAFVDSQYVPGWGLLEGLAGLERALRLPSSAAYWSGAVPVVAWRNLASAAAALALLAVGARRLPPSWTAFGLGLVLVPLFTVWKGMPRYLTGCFPAFMVLALLLAPRPGLRRAVFAFFVLTSILAMLGFSHWIYVA